MKDEIKITVDFEQKAIYGVECAHENKFEVAKALLNIANQMISKIGVKEQKIIQPKIKVVGGNNGSR